MSIDESIPLARAVFLEPLADCLHAVRDQAKVQQDDHVVVFGAGSMGLQLTGVAARRGANVLVVEPVPERRDAATAFGAQMTVHPAEWKTRVADWSDGRGFDAAIVALGSRDLATETLAAAAPGARIVFFAGFGKDAIGTLDFNLIHYRELVVTGSEWIGAPPNQKWDCYQEARGLLSSGELPLEDLVTRTISFDGISAALEDFNLHKEGKSIFYPDRDRDREAG
jgi:L-iditol 2-dehydrogenase